MALTSKLTTGKRRVAYMMSRFPKLTETFVLDEILEVQRQGFEVEVFPLWREKTTLLHADAEALVERAHFLPLINLQILADNFYWCTREPLHYLGALLTLIKANRNSLRYLAGALASFPKASTIARRMQHLGVMHLHAHFASHPAAIAFVVGRLTRIPWSFTAHGSDLHRDQAMLAEKVREAKFVVAISRYNRDFMVDRLEPGLAARIQIVHCGVDASRFERQRNSTGDFQILCIGTLHAVKGQRHLLEACALAKATLPSWHCHLIGDGPDRLYLEQLARTLGISERVTFHGSCRRERVRMLLADAQVVCAPSVPTADGRREGIPVALMEAAACGLPLIASRLSGIPELVVNNETGILTESGDSAAIARALIRLAAEPHTRQRMGATAHEKLLREFSLHDNVARLLSLMMVAPTCSV